MERLLLVQGVGGPGPRDYIPSLTAFAHLEVILVENEHGMSESDLALLSDIPFCAVKRFELFDRARELAREHGGFDGVLTFSESVLESVAQIAQIWNRPFHSPGVAKLMRDKYEQRLALARAGVPTPPFALLDGNQDPAEALAVTGVPAVLKPRHGTASVFTFPIDSLAELRAALGRAEVVRQRRRGATRLSLMGSDSMLLEGRLVGSDWYGNPELGDYVAVDTLIFRSRTLHVLVADNGPLAWPFRETATFVPSVLGEQQSSSVLEMTDAALRAIGVQHGATHTELKLTSAGPRIIEVNGRPGGGNWVLLHLSRNYDLIGNLGRMALGNPPSQPGQSTAYASMMMPQAPPDERDTGSTHLGTLPPEVVRFEAKEIADFDWELGEGRMCVAYAKTNSADRLYEINHRLALELASGRE